MGNYLKSEFEDENYKSSKIAEEVKEAAYLVADRIENDGLAKALKTLGVIDE